MTIEEKAKAYDEALEKARMYRDNAKAVEEYAAVARYENIFPQLRESKNERIRQFLIERIISLYGADSVTPDGIAVNDIVSYLEKQKEQKPDIFNESYNPDDYEVVVEGNAINLNRKEQKSIESIAAEITKDKESAIKFLKSAGIMDDNGELAEMYRSEPNPTEWHPEDEQNLNVCLSYIKDESLRNWLKDAIHVRYDKLTRSEEDDATIKSAVHWLEKYLSTIRAKDVSSATQDGILTVKTTITNLKSLPSSWKPSKELMKALGSSIVFHKDDPFVEKLWELYNQLQKL